MAITPRQPPSAKTTGEGYARTYLKRKSELLDQSLAWAQTELKDRRAGDVTYNTEIRALVESYDKQLDALRAERIGLDKAQIAASSKRSAISRKTATGEILDYRANLFKYKTEVAAAIASESTKISGQRVDLIGKNNLLYTLPLGASDQISNASKASSALFKAPGSTTAANIDVFLGDDATLPGVFNGLTEGQAQAAAIHLYNSTLSTITTATGAPVPEVDRKHVKDKIAERFGVSADDIDSSRLEFSRQANEESILKTAGSNMAALKKAQVDIDAELASTAASAGKTEVSKTDIAVDLLNLDEIMNAMLIKALSNDGAVSVEEELETEKLITKKIAELGIVESATGVTTVGNTGKTVPEFIQLVKGAVGVIDPSKSMLENYNLQQLDNSSMQSYKREGEIKTKQSELSPLRDLTDVSSDAVKGRAAEIYGPQRSRRGFGGIAPYYNAEEARRRRAIEQGVPLTEPSLGMSKRQDIQMQGMLGAAGRRMPALKPGAQKLYKSADEVLEYIFMSQRDPEAANKLSLTDEGQIIYDDVTSRIADGRLKGKDVYSSVADIMGNPDVTSLFDSTEAAQAERQKVMQKVMHDQYRSWEAKQPVPPKHVITLGESADTSAAKGVAAEPAPYE